MTDHDQSARHDHDDDRGERPEGDPGIPAEVRAGDQPDQDTPGRPDVDDAGDHWLFWTDGERARPVSHIPERPDVAPTGGQGFEWNWSGTAGSSSTAPDLGSPRDLSGGWSVGPPPGQHRRQGRATAVLAAVVAAAVLITSGIGIGWGISHNSGDQPSSAIVNPPAQGSQNDGGANTDGQVPPEGQVAGVDPNAVAANVLPALVVIDTVIGSGVSGDLPDGGASGTGMIVTSTGEILTNNHVIRGASSIRVEVAGRGTYDADVVGVDPTDDVALLQIEDVSGLPTIDVDTSDLTVGSAVVAIGNAFGQGSNSATTGSITDLEQSITAGDPGAPPERLNGLIETDAPIAPGDSGGALVDTDGQVIGMITAATRTSAFERTSTDGYAITIEDALAIVNQIRSGNATGDIILGRPGLLGVQVGSLNDSTAARLGIGTDGGALILGVVPGSPAAGAGITQGSAITVINGNDISSPADLSDVMQTTKPGQQASVTWLDTDGSHSATVQLITGPAV